MALWPGFMPDRHTIIPSNRLWAQELSKHFGCPNGSPCKLVGRAAGMDIFVFIYICISVYTSRALRIILLAARITASNPTHKWQPQSCFPQRAQKCVRWHLQPNKSFKFSISYPRCEKLKTGVLTSIRRIYCI